MIDLVGNKFLLIKASLIYCIFGEVWLDDFELVKMALAKALVINLPVLVVMSKVDVFEFGRCFGEVVFSN
jgi:hypothetical protein